MSKEHQSYPTLLEAAKAQDLIKVQAIIDQAEKVAEYVQGNVTVKNGQVFYADKPVHGTIVKKIIESMAKGLPSKPLILFLENLMLNPSEASKKELYDFLQAANLPITSDGRFIAYKWVNSNWTDCHTGRTKHEIGGYVSMPRESVDSNRHATCSSGLHVCGKGYSRFGSVLLLVAVNPKDVVSVPVDYNNHKMRACAYQVIKEVKDNDRYGKEDIVEANPIYFTKYREPEQPKEEVKAELPPVEIPAPVEPPKQEVIVHEVGPVPDGIKVKMGNTHGRVEDGKLVMKFDKEKILSEIKNKRGKAKIMAKYGLTEIQYLAIKENKPAPKKLVQECKPKVKTSKKGKSNVKSNGKPKGKNHKGRR